MNEIERIDSESENLVEERIERMRELFPEVFSESGIDFDKLRLELGDEVDDGDERYAFTWPGKKDAIRLSQTVSTATLRPCVEDSRGRDGKDGSFDSNNLYIEGDNLEVLKLLQRGYHGKVKMIYIDPPYNTGKDFIYKDNCSDSIANFREQAGLTGQSNSDASGRFHSKWCSMMYPRLRLARELLSDDGVIFASIDENEQCTLELMLNEIFGESNQVAKLIWQNKKGGGNDSKYVAIEHEYVVVYARNKASLNAFYESYSEDYVKRYKESDEIGKFYWDTFRRKSGKQYYPITCPDGTVLEFDEDGNPISWLRSKQRFESDLRDGEVRFLPTRNGWSVQFKQRMPKGKTPRSLFSTETVLDDKGTTSSGASDVFTLFRKDVFSNPKPLQLIEWLLGFGSDDDALVLDFFSGSGTTAESVFRSNLSGSNRKTILVQLPEEIDPMLESSDSNARRIAENAVSILDGLGLSHRLTELAKERIRRAGDKIKTELEETSCQLRLGEESIQLPDIGFRVFKLDESGIRKPEEGQLLIDRVKPDRTDLDIIFEMMLKWGLELTYPVEEDEIFGYPIYSVACDELICCMKPGLTVEALEAIAEREPRRVFLLDSVIDDTVKLNALQIFKRVEERTQMKIDLRTV